MGTAKTDIVWTRGWEITVPSVPLNTATTLEFTHTGGGTSSADVMVDNIVVVGGACGTSSACVCGGANRKHAAAGASTDNNEARMHIAESKGTIADITPGYSDNAELTCAHCGKQDESSWVGKNRTFNSK